VSGSENQALEPYAWCASEKCESPQDIEHYEPLGSTYSFGIARVIMGKVYCGGLAVVVGLSAPMVLGKVCGHIWGLVAAAGAIVGWVYLWRISRLSEGALSTRVIWLLGFVFVVGTAISEFAHLAHWL
jgi:hypothetical protein